MRVRRVRASLRCGFACGAAVDNVGFKTHVVRAGLNYRF